MSQRYRKAWETDPKFSSWIAPVPGEDSRVLCKLCKCTMNAHKSDLTAHGKTKKHVEAYHFIHLAGTSKKITQFMPNQILEKRKLAELKLAAFICEHCSIKTTDHLGCLLKNIDSASEVIGQMKIHRTKCTALIKNVLGPCFHGELIADIGDSFYSMIIDESTSVDTKKMMCIMVRYFSTKNKKVVTTLYKLLEVKAGDAKTLAEDFKKQLGADGLKIEKLIGIGVDGANVMVGAHNSFSSILKETVPELITVKCICHSLHLAAEYSCKVLPRHLEFLVKECHNWFSNSTKRQLEYATIYKLITGNKPLKIPKLADTRWLSRYEAIVKVVEQWDELKLHFALAGNKERCYTATHLHQLLSDSGNKLYLLFLLNVLRSLTNVNKIFQSANADPLKMLTDLNELLYLILNMIIPPARLQKVLKKDLYRFSFRDLVMRSDCINFGHYFLESSKSVPRSELDLCRERCKDFLIVLCEQLQLRIPENVEILEKISVFSPQSATSQIKSDIKSIVLRFPNICENVDAVLSEWNGLHRVEWRQLDTPESFWAEVSGVKNSAGEATYKNVCHLVLALLSLPFSNASVERAFSIVNIVKNKLRNRLSIETANAVLRVRYSLGTQGCINFEPSKAMLSKFNSENMYVIQGTQDDDDEIEETLEAFVYQLNVNG